MTEAEFRAFGHKLLDEAREVRLALPAERKLPHVLALVKADGDFEGLGLPNGEQLQDHAEQIAALIREHDVVAAVVVSEAQYTGPVGSGPGTERAAGECVAVALYWPGAGIREMLQFDIIRSSVGVDLIQNDALGAHEIHIPWLAALEC
jgi:hypothetical protein